MSASPRESRMLATGRALTALVLLLSLPIATIGCASAGLERGRRFVEPEQIHRPPLFVVYDFAVSKADVVVDQAGPGSASDAAPSEEQQAFAREVARVLADEIVSQLVERRIAAQHGKPGAKQPLHALLLKGAFYSINEGDQMSRVTVGFGAGKTSVEVHSSLFQETDLGARLIWRGEGGAQGAKMPGLLAPVTVGAALGTAARSAIVSGTLTGLRELKGPLGSDLKRLATEFANRIEAFYRDRGWLAAER